MKILRVFGQDFKVKYKDLSNEDHEGMCHKDTKLIEIHNKLKGDKRIGVELHEAMHALFYRLGYDEWMTEREQECLCEQISTLLIENYKIEWKRKS